MQTKIKFMTLVDACGLLRLVMLGIKAITKHIWQIEMTISCQRIMPSVALLGTNNLISGVA